MSVLETPRIYFKGQIAWDPITTNNYCTNYEEDSGQSILPGDVTVAKMVQDFRTSAINQVTSNGNWNPHGTHRATFYECAVCGFDLGAGVSTDDPFVSGAVDFAGMLVDLEPFGSLSSQLFFDVMGFGVEGGYHIRAPRSFRVTDRYINFARNSANRMIAGVASVVWQTSFRKTDGLRVDAFDSTALQALASGLADDDVLGLTVRFNTYRTIYYDNPDLSNGSPGTLAAGKALQSKLNGGGFQPNPARSLLVGVLGLWRTGEPVHEPGDRALTPAANSPLASAHVRLGPGSITIDLANSVPEIDKQLTKQDLGTLSLVSVADDGAKTPVADFPYPAYAKAAYEQTAGLIAAPVGTDALAAAAGGTLQLCDPSGAPLLTETVRRAVPASPNLYLSEDETVTAAFQVYDRGNPAAGAFEVTLYTIRADGGRIMDTLQATTDANGVLSVPLTGAAGGIQAYVPVLAGGDPAPAEGIDPQANTYMYVRSLPRDDFVAELPPTWDNVYANVLANWNALAPCMDNWLDLGNAYQVRSYAAVLKRLTDPANFEAFRFMPVTRDMTVGERTLLWRFLDAPDQPTAAAPAAPPGIVAFSRAMRRP